MWLVFEVIVLFSGVCNVIKGLYISVSKDLVVVVAVLYSVLL